MALASDGPRQLPKTLQLYFGCANVATRLTVLRKKMMTMWTAKILTSDYEGELGARRSRSVVGAVLRLPFTDPKTFEYMDKVGVMHTG